MFEDGPTNPSTEPKFEEVMETQIGRRKVVIGGAAGAAMFIAGTGVAKAEPETAGMDKPAPGGLGFTAIPASDADGISIPDGYTAQVFCRWGDPLGPSGPAWQEDRSNDSSDQLEQFGMGHDGIKYFPLGRFGLRSKKGILAMNHEYTNGTLMFEDMSENWTPEKTLKEQYAHGVSIAEVYRDNDGSWRTVDSRFNRRITPKTACDFSGPAAGHPLLQTEFDPTGMSGQGILNQCGNGYTPWGTYLTTEENFNGYFYGGALTVTADGAEAVPEAELSDEQAALNARYGVGRLGFGYRWGLTDTDFRADLNQTKPNTHGWMVEIDPYSPDSTPVKHTALGRFKHEGAAFTTGRNGEAVVYMGDDERFDYLYKFVGDTNWHAARQAGKSPFESGTLYAAKFNDDGTGTWLPLVYGQGDLTEANGFTSQGDVMIKTRLAADALGATPMDRPEWTTVHPYRRGEGYVTCTNNTRRTEANAGNPRFPNPYGHIIKWNEKNNDPSGTEFRFDFFLLAGAGDGTDGSTVDADDLMGSPDGLWIDQNERMWIQTDGSQPDGSNNQMLAADLKTGDIRRFFVGPPGCEVTGVTMTPDGTTMFINIQHPGFPGFVDGDPITSLWPDGGVVPRPATIAIRKDDGGVIGT